MTLTYGEAGTALGERRAEERRGVSGDAALMAGDMGVLDVNV